MARIAAIVVLVLSGTVALPGSVSSRVELAQAVSDQPSGSDDNPQPISLTAREQELVDLAVGRFDAQGLDLPEIDYVFHSDLRTCQGHKGMYHKSTRTLEMCSMDLHTMLHELAHAWANVNLTVHQMEAFVAERDVDSWNDHDHDWDRRGTEHVAETIAWALAVDPHHVKWVETLADGSTHVDHRILTIGIDVDKLLDNFRLLTGADPIFRDASEWDDRQVDISAWSPEALRAGG